jgi:tetratricopeptide (TPR) repeat protein
LLLFRSLPWRRCLDVLLLVLLALTAFLLGCYEMWDADIWWHLRGGEWILEHGRVPHFDPFTFGSADRPWVDVHWSYQIVLALAYRAGGVGALVLLGATLGCAAFLAVLSTYRRGWPATVVVLCWMPTLVLFSYRLWPRPEMFSLLYLGCYLAVLARVDDRPALVWLLLPLQILWANAQGLFILGPILVGLCLAARAGHALWRRMHGEPAAPDERRWWRHVGAAAPVLLAACLVNPYFLAGALFPFELFPKVADPNNVYKRYIAELMTPREYLRDKDLTSPVSAANWYFLSLHFVLLLLPLSFLFPALWRAWRAAAPVARSDRLEEAAVGRWVGGVALVVALTALHVLGPFAPGPDAWLARVAEYLPVGFAVAGVGVALAVRDRRPALAVVAGVGGVAQALWMAWLRSVLLGGEKGLLGGPDYSSLLAVPLGIAGLAAGVLVLRWGGRLFPALLAAAFAYLALQALQNWTRFALVAGAVLMWNFGEWACLLAASAEPGRLRIAAGFGLRVALVLALAVWIAALATDNFHTRTGDPMHFGLREAPFEFAHDAAVFAGQPEIPERALVYHIGQANVYGFHNAPRHKPFMDGRLEMPARRTFDTYLTVHDWLLKQDPRWEGAVGEMGDPLLLLSHRNNFAAEAQLLTHPGWRCIYFDAVASLFVPLRRGVSEERFPTLDFAARHFRRPSAPSVPTQRGAEAREAEALFNLATALPRSPESAWRWRVPVLLAALDRARIALDEDPTQADTWYVLGSSYWLLNPELVGDPAGVADAWKPEQSINWAQSTYCVRRAVECEPRHRLAWRALYDAYAARGMIDAQANAGKGWLRSAPYAPAEVRKEVDILLDAVRRVPPPEPASADRVPAIVEELLGRGQPEAAVRVIETAERGGPVGWSWSFADRAAGLYMHLGRPADARRIWQEARDCPSDALRRCRLASTFWVEGDLATAIRQCEEAVAADPNLGECWWGLAMLRAQQGDAGAALDACRRGFNAPLNGRQQADLKALQELAHPHAAARE